MCIKRKTEAKNKIISNIEDAINFFARSFRWLTLTRAPTANYLLIHRNDNDNIAKNS
jgi:hypothetical protein